MNDAPEAASRMKAHCPRCDGERNCSIHGSFDQPWNWSDQEHSANGQMDHRLLQCCGCETVFYWQSSWDSQSFDHQYNRQTGEEEVFHEISKMTFPAPERKSERPDWAWSLNKVDPTLFRIMSEVYSAAEQRSSILASVGLRTALDRMTELLGVDTNLPMTAKVKALVKNGWIGESEAETLDLVMDAGNAAAHRGWSPSEEEFRRLLEVVEHFLLRAIVTGKRSLAVAAAIPPRPARAPKS